MLRQIQKDQMKLSICQEKKLMRKNLKESKWLARKKTFRTRKNQQKTNFLRFTTDKGTIQ